MFAEGLVYSAAVVVLGAFATLAMAVTKGYFERWAQEQGALGARKEQAQHQADLNFELERQKSALISIGDQQRSLLQREFADYAIYAAKRHDAISTMFAEIIAALGASRDMSKLDTPATQEQHKAYRVQQIEAGYKRATDAYFQSALYLPDEVEANTRLVLNQFAELSDAWSVGELLERTQKWRALTESVERLRISAQQELRRSTTALSVERHTKKEDESQLM